MKYRCSICGYVYDDAKESVPFAQLPDTWQCPWCGAPKSSFEPVEGTSSEDVVSEAVPLAGSDMAPMESAPDMQKLSIAQMAALCSNLARGCEKQYMPAEQGLFNELAGYFTKHTPKVEDATVESVSAQLQQDLDDYKYVMQTAMEKGDRGAQRVCTWGEKVTRMLKVLVERFLKEGDAMLLDTDIWVCTVCGFVSIGQTPPEQCPICKVQAWKFNKIDRRR